MLCALTVRKLKPGALEDFKKAFIPADAPPGWTRFCALRNVDDVIPHATEMASGEASR